MGSHPLRSSGEPESWGASREPLGCGTPRFLKALRSFRFRHERPTPLGSITNYNGGPCNKWLRLRESGARSRDSKGRFSGIVERRTHGTPAAAPVDGQAARAGYLDQTAQVAGSYFGRFPLTPIVAVVCLVLASSAGGATRLVPVGPGGKIGTMRLARGTAAGADAKLFDFCDPVITGPAGRHVRRTCPRAPQVRRLFIGYGSFFADPAALDADWKVTRWQLWLGGRRVALRAFGTSDRVLSRFPRRAARTSRCANGGSWWSDRVLEGTPFATKARRATARAKQPGFSTCTDRDRIAEPLSVCRCIARPSQSSRSRETSEEPTRG